MRGIIETVNKKLTVPLAKLLKEQRWLTPNIVTILSFIISGVIAPIAIYWGYLPTAGLLTYLGALLDSLDGDLARERGIASKEGAILDAVLDRYIDLALVGALILYKPSCLLIGLLAMLGSALVPYVRAKTEAVGKKSTATIGSRDTRNLILLVGLLLNAPCKTLTALAIIANISALHRLFFALKKPEQITNKTPH